VRRIHGKSMVFTLLVLIGISARAGEVAVHWGYDGHGAPTQWATLSPEYAECARGTRQSPVDLPVSAGTDVAVEPPARMEVFHHEHALDIANNGHTVAVTYDDGDQLIVGDTVYRLEQYHFHAPSEHTIGGEHFPLELHLVHRSADGRLAVLGVMLEHGSHNARYDAVVNHLPPAPGAKTHMEHVNIDIDALLPASRSAFSYVGSLTTPPCTEGVRWLVLRTPVGIDKGQIMQLAEVLHHNSRPTQALHGRRLSATGLEAVDAP
jgi:carbonic anhydrase